MYRTDKYEYFYLTEMKRNNFPTRYFIATMFYNLFTIHLHLQWFISLEFDIIKSTYSTKYDHTLYSIKKC